MKRNLFTFIPLLAIGGLLASSLPTVRADSIKFADLEKRITVDKSPVSTENGAVASYAPALKKVMPTVVTIESRKAVEATSNPMQEEMLKRFFPDIPDEYFDRHGGGNSPMQEGLGSGVIISEDGYILTNNHVVGDADEITVILPDTHKEYEGTLVGADPRTDVALIKIEETGLQAITIGDSAKLNIGDVALAVGNPLGLEQTATIGIISAVGRNELNITNGGFENFIQTDAAINRGNSGGALVDAQGRLIGINTAIQSNFTGGNIGIGFAIPSNMALNIVQRLLDDGGTVRRGFLGVSLREIDNNYARALGRDDLSGVLITEVHPDTPAEKSGMKPGDLIVGYNDKDVDGVQRLRLDISNTSPGTDVNFSVIRNGKEKDFSVELGDLEEVNLAGFTSPGREKPEAKPKELVEGVRVKDIAEEDREALQLDESVEGVLVESVKDNVSAAANGLRPGVVITQIDQKDVKSSKEAHDIVSGFEGDVLLLQVYAGGRRDILAIPLTE
ncbi:MAG: hypothetical protein CMO55_16110 [Verrucomicrobiales bacterium]|nr:hypothetical protein [Verrucomicrobiales bacterium]